MFTLNWSEVALDMLAEIYVAALIDERERIVSSVEALNARLRSNPLEVGESRERGYRIAFAGLVSVLFRVGEAKRTVHVTSVRRFGRRK